MKRKLLLANLVLVALGVAGAVHLRREWLDARAEEQAVLEKRIRPVPAAPWPPLPPVTPVRPADYGEIAQKMLFSKDRNPVVVVEPPPKPKEVPMPPLPLFHGLVDFGDGPMAIMSEGPKAPHRDYQPGEKIGPFTLVAVDREELTLEWEGKTITKKVDDVIDRGAPAPAAAPAKQAATVHPVPAAPPPPVVAKTPGIPGVDLPGGIKACQPGDTSPAGTVTDGMRKVVRPGPFGSRCYWESEKGGASEK